MVVVGARCAGSATGMLLARLGHDVVVVDRATFPSDTLSTHVIARAGVVQLDRWGLLDAVLDSGAPPLRTVDFTFAGTPVRRSIGAHAGVDLLVAPRRYVLDEILVEATRADGADVRTGFTVHDVVRASDGRVEGIVGDDNTGTRRTILARLVVGADGLRSRIARAVGAPVTDERHRNGAIHYAYYEGVDRSALELHFAEGAFAGVFPTHHGEANVWSAGPVASTPKLGTVDRGDAFHRVVARHFPALARRTGRWPADLTGPRVRRHAEPGPRPRRDPAGRSSATRATSATPITVTASVTPSVTPRSLALAARPRAARARHRVRGARRLRAPPRPRDRRPLRRHLPARPVPAHDRVRRAPATAHRARRRRSCTARGDAAVPPRRRRRRLTPIPSTPGQEADNKGARHAYQHVHRPGRPQRRQHATLFATLAAVKQAPEAARFQFRTRNVWLTGTHSRSNIHGFYGVGEERNHEWSYTFDADHPAVLVGRDQGPTPVEFVLHALAELPHRRDRQHRGGPWGDPDQGDLDGLRRHRPQRHSGPGPVGPQRLRADHGPVPRRRRRTRRRPRGHRRAVPGPFGRLRRDHQLGARRRHGRRRLTHTARRGRGRYDPGRVIASRPAARPGPESQRALARREPLAAETYDLRRRARLADSRCVATFAGLSRVLRCARRVRSARPQGQRLLRNGPAHRRAGPFRVTARPWLAGLAGRHLRSRSSVHQPPRAVEPTRDPCATANQGERLTRVAVAVDARFPRVAPERALRCQAPKPG